MGDIGLGYGSEWHLMRFMGRHRKYFNAEVLKGIGQGTHIDWMDFNFHLKTRHNDAEHKGLAFLQGDAYIKAQSAWKEFWPQSGNPPNWDSVGWLYDNRYPDNPPELMLVEAKAHIRELKSDCGAVNQESIKKIESAINKVKDVIGVDGSNDWLHGYYQYANRIAVLWLLRRVGVPARLVFIYFIGDNNPARICPETKDEWSNAHVEMDKHMGLLPGHSLEPYMHKVFLHVTGSTLRHE